MFILLRGLFDLREVQVIDLCIAAKDRNQHTELTFIMLNIGDGTDEIDKNAVNDFNAIAHFKLVFLHNFLFFLFDVLKDFIRLPAQ